MKNTFTQFLAEKKLDSNEKLINFMYGDEGVIGVLKLLTGFRSWSDPIGSPKAKAISLMKKKGYNDDEIKNIRNALHLAYGEAIDEFETDNQKKSITKDDSKFNGWRYQSTSTYTSGSTMAPKEVREFIKQKFIKHLKK